MPADPSIPQFIRDLAAGAALLPKRRQRRREYKQTASKNSTPRENVSKDSTEPKKQPDPLSLLPGTNPYDRAFLAGTITYAEAKVRDELATRTAVGKIELEQAQIALDERKQELAVARGALITREEALARQAVLVAAIDDLIQLNVSTMLAKVPPTERSAVQAQCEKATKRALAALADAVQARADKDVALLGMQAAYMGRT